MEEKYKEQAAFSAAALEMKNVIKNKRTELEELQAFFAQPFGRESNFDFDSFKADRDQKKEAEENKNVKANIPSKIVANKQGKLWM